MDRFGLATAVLGYRERVTFTVAKAAEHKAFTIRRPAHHARLDPKGTTSQCPLLQVLHPYICLGICDDDRQQSLVG